VSRIVAQVRRKTCDVTHAKPSLPRASCLAERATRVGGVAPAAEGVREDRSGGLAVLVPPTQHRGHEARQDEDTLARREGIFIPMPTRMSARQSARVLATHRAGRDKSDNAS
jgi:hypothetical protein